MKKVTDRLTCVLRMGGWNNIGQQFPYYRRTGKLWEYLLWRTLSGQIKYPPTPVSCLLQWSTKCAWGKSGECGKHLVIFPKNILPRPTLFSPPTIYASGLPWVRCKLLLLLSLKILFCHKRKAAGNFLRKKLAPQVRIGFVFLSLYFYPQWIIYEMYEHWQ